MTTQWLYLFLAYIQANRRDWKENEQNPFSDLKFSLPPSDLASSPRLACPRCRKSHFVYCPNCKCTVRSIIHSALTTLITLITLITLTLDLCHDSLYIYIYIFLCNRGESGEGVELPEVELPLSFDIIHHPQEKLSKSTGVYYSIYIYICIYDLRL